MVTPREIFTGDSSNPAHDLMPQGRYAYSMVKHLIDFRIEGTSSGERFEDRARWMTKVFNELHITQSDGTLQPPLTPDLADAVAAASELATEVEPQTTWDEDFAVPFPHPDKGMLVLHAIFEHGYRAAEVMEPEVVARSQRMV